MMLSGTGIYNTHAHIKLDKMEEYQWQRHCFLYEKKEWGNISFQSQVFCIAWIIAVFDQIADFNPSSSAPLFCFLIKRNPVNWILCYTQATQLNITVKIFESVTSLMGETESSTSFVKTYTGLWLF